MELGNPIPVNYEKKYKEALERAKTLYENANGMILKKWVEQVFPELAESEDEKVKRILHSISCKMSFHLRDIFTEKEFQCFDAWYNAWLKKQSNNSEEYVFRPTAGCTIDEAAQQAVDKVANGENIVFSFNGFYIKIYKDTTINNIINSYNDFCKKQCEKNSK